MHCLHVLSSWHVLSPRGNSLYGLSLRRQYHNNLFRLQSFGVCVRACVRACERACVRACVRVCVCSEFFLSPRQSELNWNLKTRRTLRSVSDTQPPDSFYQTFRCWVPRFVCLRSHYMEGHSPSSSTKTLSGLLQIKHQHTSRPAMFYVPRCCLPPPQVSVCCPCNCNCKLSFV